tara:strand:- start:399 stop:1163 length:765 start_codon:yes stop_codon:yes gene_type:complete
MKIVAVIPARLASTRLNEKLLIKFNGLEMIEHVRRRAILSKAFHKVYVATGDERIEKLIKRNQGNVIRTYNLHSNGTSRAAEAVENIEASHIVLIQGDEPLILPRHLQKIAKFISSEPEFDSWNATARLDNESCLDDNSQVKCSINSEGKILYCFRRSPSYATKDKQIFYMRKMLGVIGYRKEVLLHISNLEQCYIEKFESIEQIRIISNNFSIRSIEIDDCLPSVNVRKDIDLVLKFMSENHEQQKILKYIID